MIILRHTTLVGLLWMSAKTSSGQHTIITRDRHSCQGGIRTRDPSNVAAADGPVPVTGVSTYGPVPVTGVSTYGPIPVTGVSTYGPVPVTGVSTYFQLLIRM
jgi:hypothetical protein